MILRTHSREGEAGYDMLVERTTGGTLSPQTVSLKLDHLRVQAQKHPDRVFTTLHHLIDEDFLLEAYSRTNKNAAAGVDKVTAERYAENLAENLKSLLKRYQEGKYIAPPVKRIWIEKDDGNQRPLGIPAFEDKILQRAIAMLLNAIYEVDFYDFSYGFREGRSAHQALASLREGCYREKVGVIIDADVSKFFDKMPHDRIRELLRKRMNDGKVLNLIGCWLNAGVVENESIHYPDCGSPQGGVISPLIANIFLHYVLDEWFVKEVQPRLKGDSFIVRFADDFVIGCEEPEDGARLMNVLPKRFARFGLTIHPEKSKLIRFKWPGSPQAESQAGTFDFLGFTHFWAQSRRGHWLIKRKTARKRMRKAMRNLWLYCRNEKHAPVREQYKDLCAKLHGLYNYYGIIGNYKMLEVLYEHTECAWKQWLQRRTRNGWINAKIFGKFLEAWPLPKPRITKLV